MRTSFSKLSLLALPLAALTACQDYEPFDEATVHSTMVAREYAANFISRYGQPDPNHTWGFEEMEAVSFNATRGIVDVPYNNPNVADNNRNQWMEYGMDIPGWPHVDGYYYDAAQEANEANIYDNPDTKHPCGDVTDYEIQLVSHWFRTHKITKPEEWRETLHLSEYFVMLVSSDGDRTAAWHTAYDGTKENETGYKNYSSQSSQSDFVAPVMGQNQPNFAMDHLMAKGLDGTWYHVNAFNYENSNHDPLNTVTDDRVIKYVKSAGSEDFAYHSSASDNSYMFDNWILVKLEWDEKMHDGETHHRVGYYLAFDYEAKNESSNQEYAADGYYDNWIIKIAPAQFKPTENKTHVTRVMCEDLGNTLDYDFNDVVFDVSFEQKSGSYDAIIYLRASGGTLPIYVGKNPAESGNSVYEAHTMFGKSTSTPVNVGDASSPVAPNYRITGLSAANARLIDIFVVNGNQTVCLSFADSDNLDNYLGSTTDSQGNFAIVRGDNTVPQRFAVPTSVQWMKECKFIEYGYPKFPDWVKTPTANETWYNTIGESGMIQGYVAPAGGGNGGNDEGDGGNDDNSITVTKVSFGEYTHYFYISPSDIGEYTGSESPANYYKLTFTLSGTGNFNDNPKLKTANVTSSYVDTKDDIVTGSKKSNTIAEFVISSTQLSVNENYPVFCIDGINVTSSDSMSCTVEETTAP